MDYEKKDFRKLYEDLVKSDWFKRAYHNKSLGECPFDISDLAESEDERIRKEMIRYFTEMKKGGSAALPYDDCIAYLERQKEQKLTDTEWAELQSEFKNINEAFEDGKKEVIDNPEKYGLQKENKFAPRVLPCSAAWFEDDDEEQKEQKPADEAEKFFDSVESYNQGFVAGQKKMKEDIEKGFGISEHSLDYLAGRYAGYAAARQEQKAVETNEYEIIKKHITEDFLSSEVNKRLKECRWYVTDEKPAEWDEDYNEENIQTRFAFYTYKDDPCTLYLSNVFVEETSRNKGFGTKILTAAEKVAETLGVTYIRLKVKQNSPANAWYRKNGYGYVAFEDGYDWLEKNLEYMKSSKPEWSEEDERKYQCIRSILLTDMDKKVGSWKYSEILEWYEKRGINRYTNSESHWKPTEEQMEAMKNIAYGMYQNGDGPILRELYEQLKKLL